MERLLISIYDNSYEHGIYPVVELGIVSSIISMPSPKEIK